MFRLDTIVFDSVRNVPEGLKVFKTQSDVQRFDRQIFLVLLNSFLLPNTLYRCLSTKYFHTRIFTYR